MGLSDQSLTTPNDPRLPTISVNINGWHMILTGATLGTAVTVGSYLLRAASTGCP